MDFGWNGSFVGVVDMEAWAYRDIAPKISGMAMLLSSLKDAAIRTGPGGEKGPCTQLQLLLCSLVLVKSIFFINEISVCIKWFVLKNWVHYVQETDPVESWKIKDDDFSIWSLNQFA